MTFMMRLQQSTTATTVVTGSRVINPLEIEMQRYGEFSAKQALAFDYPPQTISFNPSCSGRMHMSVMSFPSM
jgi:hypothetical protein